MNNTVLAGNELRRCCKCIAIVWALGLFSLCSAEAQTATQLVADEGFREAFRHEYEQVKAIAPDMIVLELRDRIELVASRGSQVGAASNERRVRGFESVLLQTLRESLCKGMPPPVEQPSEVIVASVVDAANTQHLHTHDTDVAELSALTQRLVDSQTPKRWCGLKSLDEVR
jgi:hypothetical protein